MSRKVQRVRYRLDAKDITALPLDEIAAILRGADDLIMSGGRSMLVKILKGSRDKKLLDLHLDESPVYGYYNHLTMDEISARVDWVILNGYIRIEYDYRLPLLCYTAKGWEIERETFARELLHGFDERLAADQHAFDMTYLKDSPRDMIFLLLEMVEKTEDPKYIPLLAAWAQVDYKKVRKRIRQVVDRLRQANGDA